MFDATLGRFRQRDPLRPAPRADNLYRYAADRPAGVSDPSGREEKTIFVVTDDPSWKREKSKSFVPASVERFDPNEKDLKSLIKAVNKGLKPGDCVKELEIGGHNSTGKWPLNGNLYNNGLNGRREKQVGKLLRENIRFCEKCEIYLSACNTAKTANLQALADETRCTVYGTTDMISGARFTKNLVFDPGGKWEPAPPTNKAAPPKK
jgi:hypothetical protein